jgi:hypothetical protein
VRRTVEPPVLQIQPGRDAARRFLEERELV